MIRRIALIVVAYLVATGAAAATLSIIGHLSLAFEGDADVLKSLPGSVLNSDVWRDVAIGAALPGLLAITLAEWRRLSALPAYLALGALSGLAAIAGFVYRTGATPQLQPLMVVTVAGAIGGLIYWALMRTVR